MPASRKSPKLSRKELEEMEEDMERQREQEIYSRGEHPQAGFQMYLETPDETGKEKDGKRVSVCH